MAKGITKNAAICVPHLVRDEGVILAVARERGCSFKDSYLHLLDEREALIARMEADPLQCGWEPPIWAVADALLGLELSRPEWPNKTGYDWPTWARMMRERLGFSEPVQVLWASGANRSSKSTWASKRTTEIMLSIQNGNVWCFDQSGPSSIKRQQRWVYDFLPLQVRSQRSIKGREAYVNFSRQNGFTGSGFIMPGTLSECEFRNYMQEKMLIEGGEIDFANCEENVPPDWLETLRGRAATRRGKIAVPYTPIDGWNGTVNLFMQNAEIVQSAPAYLLPVDGGAPDVVRALGFASAEEMAEAHRDGRWSIPENCFQWLETAADAPIERKDLEGKPFKVGDRLFERMPRVMRCPDFNAAIVFFHPMDNPFGNPLEVWNTWKKSTTDEIRKRLYGWATETTNPVFKKFSHAVHVLQADKIPTDGTNYLLIDPAGGRNWFMLWVRVTRSGKAYVYREWPGPYPIKGGLLGAWAEVSGKNEGINDGKKGPAQINIGFTMRDYIGEWARLEGWQPTWRKVLDDWMKESDEGDERDEYGDRPREVKMFRLTDDDDSLPLPEAGAKEKVFSRIMDCRAMNTASQSKNGVVTPQTVLADMGIEVEASVPVSINGTEDSGIDLVNQALSWNDELPLGPDNCPNLMFSEAVPNVIWCVQNWRNVDGNKGACKDPVDLVRYFVAGDYGYEG